MTTSNINYSAVLADLEARKAELESAIAAITSILAAGGSGGGSSDGVISPENIPVGSFLRLSIADATKKFLDMVKTKQTVPQIIKALEKGGLPPAKYQTVYAVLRRRESQFGDIIRFGDEWALSEWYPNNPNLRKKSAGKTTKKSSKPKARKKPPAKKDETTTQSSVKAATPTPPLKPPTVSSQSELTTPDAAEKILIEAGEALNIKVITDILHVRFGKKLNAALLKGILNRDRQHRFIGLGDDIWDLAARAEK